MKKRTKIFASLIFLFAAKTATADWYLNEYYTGEKKSRKKISDGELSFMSGGMPCSVGIKHVSNLPNFKTEYRVLTCKPSKEISIQTVVTCKENSWQGSNVMIKIHDKGHTPLLECSPIGKKYR